MAQIQYDEDKLKQLKSGNFDGVRLDEWFSDFSFQYIYATIKGCDKTLDYTMLNLISLYAQYLLIKPTIEGWNKESLKTIKISSRPHPAFIDEMSYEELIDFWNREIVRNCERILNDVVIVGSKHYKYYKPILKELCTNANENVRLYCCANLDYSKFLNDPSPRVAKVANIRYEFEQKWKSLNNKDQEKQRIKFLKEALEKKAIQCCDGYLGLKCSLNDQMLARFVSTLFKNSPYIQFDEDIFYTITDKRILANALNELIKEGTITLNNGIMPNYFKESKKDKSLKKSKRNL